MNDLETKRCENTETESIVFNFHIHNVITLAGVSFPNHYWLGYQTNDFLSGRVVFQNLIHQDDLNLRASCKTLSSIETKVPPASNFIIFST